MKQDGKPLSSRRHSKKRTTIRTCIKNNNLVLDYLKVLGGPFQDTLHVTQVLITER